MESPTEENVTHEPDNAPAELEIGSHMLEAVREYESTGRMLQSLAATATEHANRNPDDADAQCIAAILTAIEHAHRSPDESDPEALRFRAGVGKWDARHSSGLVRSAREYMRNPLRGPRSKEQQAGLLCSRVAYDLRIDATSQEVAENFVERLRIVAPDIAKHTCVPPSAQMPADKWRGTDAEAEAVSAVEQVVKKKRDHYDAEAIVKAALRALGCPDPTVQNFFRD